MKLIKILNGENTPEEMQLDYVGTFEEMGEGLIDVIGYLCG